MSTEEAQGMLGGSYSGVPLAFFAYPSQPCALSEAINQAAAEINKVHSVKVRTWQDMSVPGKNIIRGICQEIDRAQVFCADITGLNPSVMFELGYAVARDKRIWLVFDTSYAELRAQFDRLRLLTTTGYSPYTNSEDIVRAFLRDAPFYDLESTVFRQSIQPTLSTEEGDILFYLKSQHDTNASIQLSKCLHDSGMPLIMDDPKESSVQPLSWYGQQTYSSVAVISHFMNPDRDGCRITNTKYAFVSGLAYGFGKPLLMLAEADYAPPVDYRDLLYSYKTASEAVHYLRQWLAPVTESYQSKVVRKDRYTGALRLKVELRDFYVQIGEHMAENETDALETYYIETTAYREAVAGSRRVFVGRKGTGKTANLVALASRLRDVRDNVVCVLQPVGYEIESLVKLFRTYREHDAKGYVIESLWKFLLLTEIANATAEHIEEQPLWVGRSDEEKRLLDHLAQNQPVLTGDFSVRLERCVKALLISQLGRSVEEQRKGISEALHEATVKELRAALGDVLSNKQRVAILVDNLDKAWLREADILQLSEFLLGLFIAVSRVLNDCRKKDSRRKGVNCTAAVFLRSDIFNKVIEIAHEPDKLAITKLVWDDAEMLSQVVERRFLAAHPEAANGNEIWSRYFCQTVKGATARDYILSRILPRPRDLLYLVKSAISMAVNRGHTLIEEDDVLKAEYEYSEYAMESIKVENGVTLPELERILYEFAGCPVIVAEREIMELLAKATIPNEKHHATIQHLINLSFLGMEVRQDYYVFSDEPKEFKKNAVLAEKLAEQRQTRKYKIHSAFCAYLEIVER